MSFRDDELTRCLLDVSLGKRLFDDRAEDLVARAIQERPGAPVTRAASTAITLADLRQRLAYAYADVVDAVGTDQEDLRQSALTSLRREVDRLESSLDADLSL